MFVYQPSSDRRPASSIVMPLSGGASCIPLDLATSGTSQGQLEVPKVGIPEDRDSLRRWNIKGEVLSTSDQSFPTHHISPIAIYPHISLAMCCLRQVRNYYTRCGHGITLPDEEIKCDARDCKFSPNHPRHCPQCKATCWQTRQYPQQYSPHLDAFCPDCIAAGVAH